MASVDLDAKRFKEGSEKLRQAISWQKKALDVNPVNPGYRQFLENHLFNLIKAAKALGNADEAAQAEHSLADLAATSPLGIALDARLDAVIRGSAPKDNRERLQLAYRAYEKKLNAASVRLFAEALESERSLPDDRLGPHRYFAASAAAQAAATTTTTPHPTDNQHQKAVPITQNDAQRGESNKSSSPGAQEVARVSENSLSDADRAKLRNQAHAWLEAELETWSSRLRSADDKQRQAIAENLKHWQEDASLAGVRDGAALTQLPEVERKAWQSLWERVESLRTKASSP